MGTEVVRYNYRLRPGITAERALIEEWHRCRFLWNEAVVLVVAERGHIGVDDVGHRGPPPSGGGGAVAV